MASRTIKVELIGDASSLNRALGSAQTNTSKFGRVAKTALIGGAAAGLYALGKAAKIGWDEFNQGQKVAAQTNAVIKSTGGVAKVTAGHVADLATELMNLSGVDDEVIASGENVLLTFTKVRNEAGKGNDIFDQATRAALDLSVALGTDLQSANIQLGKALQGSSTGLTALKRSGVTFSDKQVALINRLFETNHTLRAQKIILQEVQKEFGGSAKAAGETLPGKLDILRERFRNFTGDLVEKTLPALSDFVDFIDDVSKGRNINVKIHTILAGAGTALEKLLFGSPAERVRVPVDQKHFEWVVKGGGDGLVGAIGKAIRDINWTEVGSEIAKGLGDAGAKAGDSLMEQFAKTAKDKITKPSDVFGAWWSATKVEAEFFPATHVWRKVMDLIQDDAKAATGGVNKSFNGVVTHMGSTADAARTFQGAMSEHLMIVKRDADSADRGIEQLRATVASLRSKTIHINAVVSGLSYVSALQEHLDLLHSKTVTATATPRPTPSATPRMVSPRSAAGGGGGNVQVIVLGGDRPAVDALREMLRPYARQNAGRTF